MASKVHPDMASLPLMILAGRHRPRQERLPQKEIQLSHLLNRRHQSLPQASSLIMVNSSKELCMTKPGPKEIGHGPLQNGGAKNSQTMTPSTPGQETLPNITTHSWAVFLICMTSGQISIGWPSRRQPGQVPTFSTCEIIQCVSFLTWGVRNPWAVARR